MATEVLYRVRVRTREATPAFAPFGPRPQRWLAQDFLVPNPFVFICNYIYPADGRFDFVIFIVYDVLR